MRVLVDVKNLGLYSAGIAQFFRPLLAAWIGHRSGDRFCLAGPEFDHAALSGFDNWEHHHIGWPTWLLRPLRHPFYDNVLFPRALARLQPDIVFSPYHDVRLPRPDGGIRSFMMIHDTCIDELRDAYPRRIRSYYLAMLRVNLSRTAHILTVSDASREQIMQRYDVAPSRVSVIYNSLDGGFSRAPVNDSNVRAIREQHQSSTLLFYPGGGEFRKNIDRLAEAFALLVTSGSDARLLVTGEKSQGWTRALAGISELASDRVYFLGHLKQSDLVAHYKAADVVVYPTLCEGFGRVCLESMATGTPLACSDLPVLREVAGEYPQYFDPHSPAQIVAAIGRAAAAGRKNPVSDARFAHAAVQHNFLALMDRLMAVRASARP